MVAECRPVTAESQHITIHAVEERKCIKQNTRLVRNTWTLRCMTNCMAAHDQCATMFAFAPACCLGLSIRIIIVSSTPHIMVPLADDLCPRPKSADDRGWAIAFFRIHSSCAQRPHNDTIYDVCLMGDDHVINCKSAFNDPLCVRWHFAERVAALCPTYDSCFGACSMG